MMDAARAAASLLRASAARERAHEMLVLCEAGSLAHWRLDRARLSSAATYVLETMRRDYPDFDIPFHARWRHFRTDRSDRGAPYGPAGATFASKEARSAAAIDLAVVSVLLDAGAGSLWRYRTSEGDLIGRSEGLAIASVDMFEAGFFSSSKAEPRRVDAAALAGLAPEDLARGLQIGPDNPLEGAPGRLALLRGLGRALAARPNEFAQGRPGDMFERLGESARGAPIGAPAVLELILQTFAGVWPGRISIEGVGLGDTWRHKAIVRQDATNGLVPFHKLSQWMTYSLIEPLQWGGLEINDLDGLTGLPEYRNGGLFVDLGVLSPRSLQALADVHSPADEIIVEWRALTLALLDELASMLRERLGLDKQTLPLACVLQGGTWSAGRRIARELRADGAPPLAIRSDGTVF